MRWSPARGAGEICNAAAFSRKHILELTVRALGKRRLATGGRRTGEQEKVGRRGRAEEDAGGEGASGRRRGRGRQRERGPQAARLALAFLVWVASPVAVKWRLLPSGPLSRCCCLPSSPCSGPSFSLVNGAMWGASFCVPPAPCARAFSDWPSVPHIGAVSRGTGWMDLARRAPSRRGVVSARTTSGCADAFRRVLFDYITIPTPISMACLSAL